MRILLVLLCFAVPAEAATWRLTGAGITECRSRLYLDPDLTIPDPAPCEGQVGRSFDGKVRIVRGLVDGPLRDRWLYLPPEPGLFPEEETLAPEALKVRLGFPWEGNLSAGIHINRRGQIDKWWFTTNNDDGSLWQEAAWTGIHTSTLDFVSTGPAGKFVRVRPQAKVAQAGIAAVPLPAAGWLLLAGVLMLQSARAGRTRLSTLPRPGRSSDRARPR